MEGKAAGRLPLTLYQKRSLSIVKLPGDFQFRYGYMLHKPYQLSAWLMRPSFTTIAPTEIKRIPDIRRIKRYGYDTQTQRRLLITNFQQLFSASGIQSIQSHRITAVVIQ